MNLEFIKRAEKITSFNLKSSDFTSTTFKKEIQHLFNKHFFPKFDLSKTIDGINVVTLNRLISELKREDRELLYKLHFYPLNGVGPGEATLYFLVNDARLGGGSSAGLDIITNSGGYEVKSVEVSSDGYAKNFKLGGTFQIADLVKRAQELKQASGAGAGSEVNKSEIEKIKEKLPNEWKLLEEEFVDRSYNNYFKNHEIIFMYNSGAKFGEIASMKKVQKRDIVFERVTQNTIKPMVKL